MSKTTLRIYGRDNSISVQKVLWTCAELDLPFERVDRGGAFGGTATPEYRAMNPTGRIPTIDDNGFILWESNAIVRYLAARYGSGSLCPRDEQARAAADQWMDWQAVHVWPGLQPAFLGLVRTPPEQRNQAAIDASVQRTAEQFALLDTQLRRHAYIAGDAFTMADIPIGTVAQRWFGLGIERPALEALAAWYQRLKSHAGFARHVDKPLS